MIQKKFSIFGDAKDLIDGISHRFPEEEIRFYLAVVRGDVEAVKRNCEEHRFLDKEGVGVLSKDPLSNIKYHYVITAALITRLCSENGLEWEEAFRMSDYHIQKLDNAHTIHEVHKMHDEMVLDYTQKMYQISQIRKHSKHVNDCKTYINSHINERVTVEEIAAQIGVSTAYLSRLFKKETGESVSEYIRCLKIERAKNLLQYSDYPVIEISNRLAFSSQSHFIQQFKEITGMTPKKYRDLNYMKVWTIGR